MDRVATHWIEERRIFLEAQYEARMHQRNQDVKGGAMATEIVIPEF